MSRLVNAFCLVLGLAACDDENTFDVSDLIAQPEQEITDIGERWLKEILSTMQGETGQYLISQSQKHDITIAYADNLQHALGQYSPSKNAVTLELPLGIETATPEQFQEMVLTGRRVMYEELDHGVRHHERDQISGLSAQDAVDGRMTSNEAIARISAYVGMSEDAQIGSAPNLKTQLGMPESGHAIYYATTDAAMADEIVAGLAEGKHFHESPELIAKTFHAFFDTSSSASYTLRYASHILPDNFEYSKNVSLAQVLDEYKGGDNLQFDSLVDFANLINVPDDTLLQGMQTQFENGDFTNEAEQLTLNDLLRERHRLSQPDGGRANHLAKTNSGGSFFRNAPAERISNAFNALVQDAEIIQEFMSSCRGKPYLPENVRGVVDNNHEALTSYLPVLHDAIGKIQSTLSGEELDAPSRIQLERLYQKMEAPLVTPSRNRVKIYNGYVEERSNNNMVLCP